VRRLKLILNKFKHKETGNIYVVEKVINEYGIDIVIYVKDKFPKTTNDRRYARDLYKFLDNMELVKEE